MLKTTVFAECDNGRPSVVARFTDVTELVEYAHTWRVAHGHPTDETSTHSGEWSEGTWKWAKNAALNGDQQYVPGALDLLAEVDAVLPPTNGAATVRSVYGGRVNLSDWRAGSPTPMRRRHRQITDRGLVQIFLPFAASASLGTSQLLPRGNAIMALIMKIQQYRPVQVWLYDETQVKGQSRVPFYYLVGVSTQPLSLAHVGFAVSHPAFFREIGWQAEEQSGAHASAWTHDMHHQGYEARRNARIGANPVDLVLSSATDWNPLINHPIEWIKSELQRMEIEA